MLPVLLALTLATKWPLWPRKTLNTMAPRFRPTAPDPPSDEEIAAYLECVGDVHGDYEEMSAYIRCCQPYPEMPICFNIRNHCEAYYHLGIADDWSGSFTV
jgi:hypothetical protein